MDASHPPPFQTQSLHLSKDSLPRALKDTNFAPIPKWIPPIHKKAAIFPILEKYLDPTFPTNSHPLLLAAMHCEIPPKELFLLTRL